ncbi:carbon-nitrogen hydrolase family protein [Mycobacterium sherrisii]|uniref:Aliphatic nitrilase n=1 Tax=Mycobacterium sherrisii TaxID=243061 RepID=A0A1E3SQ95_9MYCO|nr:carbon-nitrogen hydrolase family protein [Mycobacterium sherrisii]MCV7028085.1 carbon-nitrogen hydrolase family protein [Mycobacterium sherrisii]MEC4762756.1 carbon-nitrogen hydrolase family protein [Mycobacterium sherrisii]ODR04272.1 aliphatic nitrilase [Mycobacterium sherrisii]ORW78784.1 aliphatic nitrilase [Mycobacterium sherrisii]
MSALDLPKVAVAAVNAAPVFLDLQATLDKVEDLVASAARDGAQLVVFGEAFLAGFPIWTAVLPPIDQHEWHERLIAQSIVVPSPPTERLARIARAHGVTLSVGINERNPNSLGQLWNSNLIFDPSGRLVNHRRKLVATYYERLTWSHGDAHDLRPVDLGGWRLGALICGENTNTLARFTLLAQGERLHIATYPPAWPFDGRSENFDYDLAELIRLRSASHAFEGKVFVVVAATALDETALQAVSRGDARIEKALTATPPAAMVIGPNGQVVAGPLTRPDAILHAEVDLQTEVVAKQAHDIVGTYNRADIFSLSVDMSRPAILRANHDGSAPNQSSIDGQRSTGHADAPAPTAEDRVVVTNHVGSPTA